MAFVVGCQFFFVVNLRRIFAGIVVPDNIPGRKTAMPKNILTVASRKRLESRKRLTPFRKNSRVMNQFKPIHWPTVCQWVTAQQERGLLMLKEGETPDSITCLKFKFRPHARHGRGEFCKYDVYLALADLIRQVGRTEGMEHNLMVFYRYISSPDHSNLKVKFKTLKRQLSGMIRDH